MSHFSVFVFPAKLKESVLKKKKTPSFSNLVFKEIPPTFRSKRYFFPYSPIQDVKPHHTKSGLYEYVSVVEGEEIKA